MAYFALGPIVSVVVLLLSQSRTGWLVAVCGLIAVLIPLPQRHRSRWVSGLLAAFVVIAQLPVLLADGVTGFHGRAFAWHVAWEEFQTSPLIGVGTDVFSHEYWEANRDQWLGFWLQNWKGGQLYWEPAHAHNQFLQTAAVGGIVALSALLLLAGILAYIAVKAFDVDSRWMIGTLVILVTVGCVEVVLGVGLVSGTFVLPLVLPVIAGSSIMLMKPASPARLP